MPNYISGKELMAYWDIEGFELLDCLKKGLQPYTQYGQAIIDTDTLEHGRKHSVEWYEGLIRGTQETGTVIVPRLGVARRLTNQEIKQQAKEAFESEPLKPLNPPPHHMSFTLPNDNKKAMATIIKVMGLKFRKDEASEFAGKHGYRRLDRDIEMPIAHKGKIEVLTSPNNISIIPEKVKTEIDIEEVIQSGEHGFLEFKSSMRWNSREARIDKKIEEIILKSVSAFSNSKGGKLLIGVADNGEVIGLQDDYDTLKEANKNHFELHLRNLINNAFGKDFAATNVNINFPIIDENEICEINIEAGTKPLFLEVTDKNGQKQKKFYVRSGNSSQDLAIDEATSYAKKRFEY